ncbi:MAG: IS1634 family transposase [Bacteroidales bacterium]
MKTTIANLSDCTPAEISALKIALKHKNNLQHLELIKESQITNGKIAGPSIALYQIAQSLGITDALGRSNNANFVLWLIISRLIEPGSRLSAVRLANIHYGCEVIGISHLNENNLYGSLDWLYQNKQSIENKMFANWRKKKGTSKTIFLYDVSSSYVEGDKNELASYGYNRDKKQGKKQIVYGLLTDEQGEPLGVEVFRGNTRDTSTVSAQIKKIKEQFGCEKITFVGDKGMIKSMQMDALSEEKFNYITTITKPQIEKLLKEKVIQKELFTDQMCEIEDTNKSIRYILHRNPFRAQEIQQNRTERIRAIEKKLVTINDYLQKHPRAKLEIQQKNLTSYIEKLKLKTVITLYQDEENRKIIITHNAEELEEMSLLDGCYVIQTDLPKDVATKETIHARYKALAEVEWAFRTEKSLLEVRPLYLRKKERTIAHLEVCMIAYKIELYLRKQWYDINVTVEEGLKTLSMLSSIKIKTGENVIVKIPHPDEQCKELLQRIDVKMPTFLSDKKVDVVTYKKLRDTIK